MNLEAIQQFPFKTVEQAYTHKDTILYALGIGFGQNPVDPVQLAYVYEEGLKAVPSYACVLAHPGFWVKEPALGIVWQKLLHIEQRFTIHEPLPPRGTMRGSYRIAGVEDRGTAKGAVLQIEKELRNAEDNRLHATVTSVYLLRGDGGQGGFGALAAPLEPLPERAADKSFDLQSPPDAALLYRLSGDWNPLHASPAIAKQAGFDRPILQGLCTLGYATNAALQSYAGAQAERIASMAVRFSRPVFPGDLIRTEFYEESGAIRFRSIALPRNEVVLDRGVITLRS